MATSLVSVGPGVTDLPMPKLKVEPSPRAVAESETVLVDEKIPKTLADYRALAREQSENLTDSERKWVRDTVKVQGNTKAGVVKALSKGANALEIRKRIYEFFDSRDYNPLASMIDLVDDIEGRMRDVDEDRPVTDREMKVLVDINKEIMKYTLPLTRAIDIQGTIDANVSVNLLQFTNDMISGTDEAFYERTKQKQYREVPIEAEVIEEQQEEQPVFGRSVKLSGRKAPEGLVDDEPKASFLDKGKLDNDGHMVSDVSDSI